MIIKEALRFVDELASERIDSAATILIEESTLDVGQFIPQGDVALEKLAKVPGDARRVANPDAQIAEGNTKGARHIWDSMDGIKVYQESNADPLVGCIYSLTKEQTLTHPEHGDHVYHAGFIGRARFQRAFADELRRIAD